MKGKPTGISWKHSYFEANEEPRPVFDVTAALDDFVDTSTASRESTRFGESG